MFSRAEEDYLPDAQSFVWVAESRKSSSTTCGTARDRPKFGPFSRTSAPAQHFVAAGISRDRNAFCLIKHSGTFNEFYFCLNFSYD